MLVWIFCDGQRGTTTRTAANTNVEKEDSHELHFFFVIIIIKSKNFRPFDAITFYVRLIVGLIIIVSNESYFARVE